MNEERKKKQMKKTLQDAYLDMLDKTKNEPCAIRPVNKYAWMRILGISDIKYFLKKYYGKNR